MINNSFMLQILKGSGTISFHLNDTVLPTLYALLNLDFDLPLTLSWFESRFKFLILNVTMSVTKSNSLMISLVMVIALKHAKFALNMTVHTFLV